MSQTLDKAQVNYATMEKEFLAVVFVLEKFRSYLIKSKVIIFIIMPHWIIFWRNLTLSPDLFDRFFFYKSSIWRFVTREAR